jgi:hypothetical protein
VKLWLLGIWLFVLADSAAWLPVANAQEVTVSHERDEDPVDLRIKRDPNATWSDVRDLRSFGWFAAGAVSGFLLHEAGHLFGNLVQGNVPQFQGILGFGFIPFFTIAPRIYCEDDKCYKHDGSEFWSGPRGKFAITSAGYNVQHLTDEIMLSRTPELRYRVAPFRKGLLAFNILLSVGYATAAITGIENPQGDLSRSAELIGFHPAYYATMLLIPAFLDTYRYFRPGSSWAPWISRTGKAAVVGLMFAL